ncbi:MAG: aspartate kinase [bacterium]|nr:aspartate kinase [bacterium]
MPNAIIAAKFGGTSVEDAASIIHLRDNIVRCDPRRRAIVVSAPAGVTNMLIRWVKSFIDQSRPTKDVIMVSVRRRFARIARELELSLDIDAMFREIQAHCEDLRSSELIDELYHYAVSRGEWVNGQIVAATLDFEFVDALRFIVVDRKGHCKLSATKRLAEQIGLVGKTRHGIVVGGFYGRASSGTVRPTLFSRGGSDITGAIVAVLVRAKVYENWTDVAGIFAAHPHIVRNPRKNGLMTYKELRELTFMGFKVFHEDAVAFVRDANIPIHVRCTMTPEKQGTIIVKKLPKGRRPIVTGVASRNGFSIVTLEKYGLNDNLGVQGRIERVFTQEGVGVNTTGSIDSVTVIVETKLFKPVRDLILKKLKRFQPDDIRVQNNIALICTVGEGMRNRVGVSAAVSDAIATSRTNVEIELQGGSQINVMRGVKEKNGPRAVRAIDRKFSKKFKR